MAPAGCGQRVDRGVARLEADPGRTRPGRACHQRVDLAGRHARPGRSRWSAGTRPPRSIPAIAGVSNTCTHSTRLPSRCGAAATLTSASRIAGSSSRSPTVRTECSGIRRLHGQSVKERCAGSLVLTTWRAHSHPKELIAVPTETTTETRLLGNYIGGRWVPAGAESGAAGRHQPGDR